MEEGPHPVLLDTGSVKLLFLCHVCCHIRVFFKGYFRIMFSLPLLFFLIPEDSCLTVCLPPSKGPSCPFPQTAVLLAELGEAGSHPLPAQAL